MAQQKRRTAPKKRRAAPQAGRQDVRKAGRSSAQRGRTAADANDRGLVHMNEALVIKHGKSPAPSKAAPSAGGPLPQGTLNVCSSTGFRAERRPSGPEKCASRREQRAAIHDTSNSS